MGGYEEQILDGKSWNIEGPLEGKDKTLLVLKHTQYGNGQPTEYEIYVTKYLLVWKKTRAASGNIWNNVF